MRRILSILVIGTISVALLLCVDLFFHLDGIVSLLVCGIVVFLTFYMIYEVERRHDKNRSV